MHDPVTAYDASMRRSRQEALAAVGASCAQAARAHARLADLHLTRAASIALDAAGKRERTWQSDQPARMGTPVVASSGGRRPLPTRSAALLSCVALTTCLWTPYAAAGQEPRTPLNVPPSRIRSVTVALGDECPLSTADEVVVCYDGIDPYRIPKKLRRGEPPAANQSWVNRASVIDEVSRVAAGLPNTCSVVGTGGQTGCSMAAMRAWRAERRTLERAAEGVP